MVDNRRELPQHHDATDLLPGVVRRHAVLAGTIVVGLVLVGFLTGIKEPPPIRPPVPHSSGAEHSAPPAVTYLELPKATIKANSRWENTLAKLASKGPGPFDPVVRTEEGKQQALADRARHRAFDGAPPTVPHPTIGMTAESCNACHGQGLKVGERIATKMSHPFYSNCTQCHAEEGRPELKAFADAPGDSDFIGKFRAGPGTRAGPGAPPTMPHPSFMREDCTSCHGLIARPGIRTTHPWLSNCTQCHAPSAELDQVDFTKERK